MLQPKISLALSAVVCLLFLAAFIIAMDWNYRASAMPMFVSGVGSLLALVNLIRDVKQLRLAALDDAQSPSNFTGTSSPNSQDHSGFMREGVVAGRNAGTGPSRSRRFLSVRRTSPLYFLLWFVFLIGLLRVFGAYVSIPIFVCLFLFVVARLSALRAIAGGLAVLPVLYILSSQLGLRLPSSLL